MLAAGAAARSPRCPLPAAVTWSGPEVADAGDRQPDRQCRGQLRDARDRRTDLARAAGSGDDRHEPGRWAGLYRPGRYRHRDLEQPRRHAGRHPTSRGQLLRAGQPPDRARPRGLQRRRRRRGGLDRRPGRSAGRLAPGRWQLRAAHPDQRPGCQPTSGDDRRQSGHRRDLARLDRRPLSHSIRAASARRQPCRAGQPLPAGHGRRGGLPDRGKLPGRHRGRLDQRRRQRKQPHHRRGYPARWRRLRPERCPLRPIIKLRATAGGDRSGRERHRRLGSEQNNPGVAAPLRRRLLAADRSLSSRQWLLRSQHRRRSARQRHRRLGGASRRLPEPLPHRQGQHAPRRRNLLRAGRRIRSIHRFRWPGCRHRRTATPSSRGASTAEPRPKRPCAPLAGASRPLSISRRAESARRSRPSPLSTPTPISSRPGTSSTAVPTPSGPRPTTPGHRHHRRHHRRHRHHHRRRHHHRPTPRHRR